MLAYKAFHKDLTCTLGRGKYRYQVGAWHEENSANCAEGGFHAVRNPLHCFTYYPGADCRYFICELAGDVDEDCTDTKVAATKIRLIRELTVWEMAAESCRYLLQHPLEPIQTGGYGRIRVAAGLEPTIGGLAAGEIVLLCRKDEAGITRAVALLRGGERYCPEHCYALEADGQIAEKEGPYEAL